MSVINGHDLSRAYGDDDIFDAVSVSVPHGARIGLVGPNGSGKTSLIRILALLEPPDSGLITHAKGTRTGYLPQNVELELSGAESLWDEMLTVYASLREQEGRLADLAARLATNPGDYTLLEAYGDAQHRLEEMGGYDYENRIEQVLYGLGFAREDFQRPIVQLSGGQKTRAVLARLILEEPDVLLLDEPTNHLDIQAIEWLENRLRDFKGALVIISHDRFFLDRLVTHIWELMFGRVEEYRGNYSQYVQQREARHELLLKEYERQQEFIAKEEDYIRRNIAGQNTRQAQGRRKRLERFLHDEKIARPRAHRTLHLSLKAGLRSGDEVLQTRNLVIGYHDDRIPLFEVPDITLYRGECAALIGPNGAGKSTFMKTILGQLSPLSGEVRQGASVAIGYFAQAHEGLNAGRTVLSELMDGTRLGIAEARDYLGRYLFHGDDVEKTVSMLSGGERGRLALAKLALSGANLLLLDEPTNHLDIPSQEILEAALDDFAGTILLISHDRYLIRNLATQIWALYGARRSEQAKQGELNVFKGGYEEYLAWRDAPPAIREAPAAPTKPVAKGNGATRPGDEKRPLSRHERQKRLQQVEADIHRLEVEMVNLSGALEAASTASDVAEVTRLGLAYDQISSELESLLQEWEDLMASE